VTSDVQDVDVCVGTEGLVIRCIFLGNSMSIGCGYKLVSTKDDVADIFGHVPSTNTEGQNERIKNITSYSEILIYDAMGRDDRTNFDIAVKKSLQYLSSCYFTPGTKFSGGKSHKADLALLLLAPLLLLALSLIPSNGSLIT